MADIDGSITCDGTEPTQTPLKPPPGGYADLYVLQAWQDNKPLPYGCGIISIGHGETPPPVWYPPYNSIVAGPFYGPDAFKLASEALATCPPGGPVGTGNDNGEPTGNGQVTDTCPTPPPCEPCPPCQTDITEPPPCEAPCPQPALPAPFSPESAECSGLIPPGILTIPVPGSQAWCDWLPQAMAWVRQLSDTIVSWAADQTIPDAGGGTGWIGTALQFAPGGSLLYAMLDGLGPAFRERLKTVARCWAQVALSFGGCNSDVLLALSVCRAMLRALHNVRVGTDAAVWFTLDIDVALHRLEEILQHLERYACPTEIPSGAEAIRTWLDGAITEEQRDCWLKMQGQNPAVWEPVWFGQRKRPGLGELARLADRGQITEGDYDDSLRDDGVIDGNDAARFRLLRQQWLTPDQAIRAYWRLRPGRDTVGESADTARLSFGADDLAEIMRAAAFPKRFQPIISAISEPLPSVRVLKTGIRLRTIDRKFVKEIYRKQGYSEAYAELITETLFADADRASMRDNLAQARGLLESARESGAIDDDTFYGHLIDLGLTDEDARISLAFAEVRERDKDVRSAQKWVKSSYMDGEIDAVEAGRLLGNTGMVTASIGPLVDEWQRERTNRHKQIRMRELVTDACDGIVSIPFLISRGRKLNYTDEDINVFVREAQLCILEKAQKQAEREQKLAEDRKHKSAGRAGVGEWRQWYTEGMATDAEVRDHFGRLDWTAADIDRLLRSWQRKISPPKPPVGTKPSGNGSGGSGGGNPPKGGPTVAELTRWWTEDIITETELRDRLRADNWSDADITRHEGDALAKIAARQSRLHPPGK